MEELKLGKVTNQELAEWFNATVNSITKKKQQWLKVLQEYCEFTPVYGGVIITKIYKPFYTKNMNLKIVQEEFNEVWDKSNLDSCKRVSEEIYEKRQKDFTVAESTIYHQTRQTRDEFYGKPMLGQGSKGTCYYVWCKKNKNGKLEYLSEEEEQIKKKLMEQYFSTADEKTIMVQQMIENNEITEQEAWGYYSELLKLPHNYRAFMTAFKKETGINLIKGTVLENQIIWGKDKEQEFTF